MLLGCMGTHRSVWVQPEAVRKHLSSGSMIPRWTQRTASGRPSVSHQGTGEPCGDRVSSHRVRVRPIIRLGAIREGRSVRNGPRRTVRDRNVRIYEVGTAAAIGRAVPSGDVLSCSPDHHRVLRWHTVFDLGVSLVPGTSCGIELSRGNGDHCRYAGRERSFPGGPRPYPNRRGSSWSTLNGHRRLVFRRVGAESNASNGVGT
jgi:hypothetical protein